MVTGRAYRVVDCLWQQFVAGFAGFPRMAVSTLDAGANSS